MGEIVDKLVGTNTSTTMKFLIDPAEQFFGERIKELEQVCVNRLVKIFIAASESSQLIRK